MVDHLVDHRGHHAAGPDLQHSTHPLRIGRPACEPVARVDAVVRLEHSGECADRILDQEHERGTRMPVSGFERSAERVGVQRAS